jgi:hypothetical protein
MLINRAPQSKAEATEASIQSTANRQGMAFWMTIILMMMAAAGGYVSHFL